MDAHRKTIGGREFAFGMMSATEAIRVEVALMRVLGEPLFRMFAGHVDAEAAARKKVEGGKGKTSPADMKAALKKVGDEIGSAAAAQAIAILTSKMDADDLIATMDRVFAPCRCQGQSVVTDLTFAPDPETGKARNREVWQVFAEALKVNFADLLPGGLSGSPAATP